MVDFDPCPGAWSAERVAGCQLVSCSEDGWPTRMEPVLEARLCMSALNFAWEHVSLQYMRTSAISDILHMGEILTFHIPTLHTIPLSVRSYQSLQMS
jgi:hypothetical protein